MQALPPPPPVKCVKAANAASADLKSVGVVSGEPEQVEVWLAEAREVAGWKIEADASSNGFRFVRMSFAGDVPYRILGGLIYLAQLRRLQISIQTEPPICEAEEE